jgi:hypothetical protein
MFSNQRLAWRVLAFVAAINVQAQEPSADLQNKRGKLPKEVVAKSTDVSTAARDVGSYNGGKPPVARVEIVKDTYFGETVEDPYRWMENDPPARKATAR